MRTMSLLVAGMRCRSCVREVSAGLRDVAGVETVVADADHSTVRLSGTMKTDDVLRAFDGLRYPVQLLDEPDAATGG